MAEATGTLRSVNPATGKELASYAEHTPGDLDIALAGADAVQRAWRRTSFAERRRCLEAAARLLREGRDEYARLATLEMGKPIAEAVAEVDKCAWNCEFYAARAEGFLADEPVETDAFSSYVAYQPLGVVLAIMPWNFPYWQVLRFAAPALMAGNGALLKHSPNVPGCALAVEELFTRAGFPSGLFRTLLVTDASVGDATGRLLADRRVAAVTLTGSERAGAAARARFLNGGQSCIAAKRFIVEEPVADEFERRFAGGRHPPDAGVPGGDLRPGGGRRPRRRRADGGRAGQRHSLRARGQHLDPRRRVPPSGWDGGSSRARCSSTRWSPPTPGSPSAGSSGQATAASWPRPASASSPTSAPSGSSPRARPRRPP
jgi:succinate-semialdehyde dehydrogenase/glutarate-semialdehyde dehydrogenase